MSCLLLQHLRICTIFQCCRSNETWYLMLFLDIHVIKRLSNTVLSVLIWGAEPFINAAFAYSMRSCFLILSYFFCVFICVSARYNFICLLLFSSSPLWWTIFLLVNILIFHSLTFSTWCIFPCRLLKMGFKQMVCIRRKHVELKK